MRLPVKKLEGLEHVLELELARAEVMFPLRWSPSLRKVRLTGLLIYVINIAVNWEISQLHCPGREPSVHQLTRAVDE